MPSPTPSWASMEGPGGPTPPQVQQNSDQHPGHLKGSTPEGNDYAPAGTTTGAPVLAAGGDAGLAEISAVL